MSFIKTKADASGNAISTPTRKAPDTADDANLAQSPAMDKEDQKKAHQGKTTDKNGTERTKPETQLSEAAYAPYDETPHDMPEQRDTAGTVAALMGVPILYPNEMPKKKPRPRTFNKKS
jgi:hypothetical protein